MKDKEKIGFLQYISRHQYAFVWMGLYLFLFSAGIRFDWFVSLVSSTVAIVFLLLFEVIVRKVLILHLLRPHRQCLYYICSFLTIFIFVWLTANCEVSIFKVLYENDLVQLPSNITRGEKIFPVFKMIILFIICFTVITISYLLSQTKEANEKNAELKNEKLDMELRYLKAQINPHFLFNALNNVYSMVYTNDENAAESVLKLSEMLRYVMDECQTDKISVVKEVKYIDNYIDFQLMRMESHPDIVFNKNIQNPDFKIPPMIFQPLIENCFKHSRLESNHNGFIHIELKQSDNELLFIAENTLAPCLYSSSKDRDGIGVQNVKKRLDFAYGKNYSFHVENNSQFYRTELKIKIS